jgi:hypothetical protein
MFSTAVNRMYEENLGPLMNLGFGLDSGPFQPGIDEPVLYIAPKVSPFLSEQFSNLGELLEAARKGANPAPAAGEPKP